MSGLKLSLGTAAFTGTDAQREALQTAKAAGIKEIDTAHMYAGGQHEVDLGAAGAAEFGFDISTKNAGGWAGGRGVALKPENLLRTARESLQKLKIKQLDIFYIHGPDRTMKLDEWVPSIHKLYEEGVFRRFGVSNFSPEEVRELYNYSKGKGYVLPTVYQGNYNPVARKIEESLFPTLRELGIVFYAYSPLAGGFLAKKRQDIEGGTADGRFSTNKDHLTVMYSGMYVKPSFLDALDTWGEIAEKEGVSKSELAYRWVYYHSIMKPDHGDTLIMGASKLQQITSSAEGLSKGPLSKEASEGINAIWDTIKHEASLDNFDATQN